MAAENVAAGAVGVRGVDALGAKLGKVLAVVDQVGRVTGQVTAFDHHPARAERGDRPRGLPRGIGRVDRDARQHLGLRDIRRHHERERQQMLLHRGDGALLQQRVTALGNHHRIDHQLLNAPGFEATGDCFHDRGAGEHPGLGRGGADVLEHDVDLNGDDLFRHLGHGEDPARVLSGHRRYHRRYRRLRTRQRS